MTLIQKGNIEKSVVPKYVISFATVSFFLPVFIVSVFGMMSIFNGSFFGILITIIFGYLAFGLFRGRVTKITESYLIIREANSVRKVLVKSCNIVKISCITDQYNREGTILILYKNHNLKLRKAEFFINFKEEILSVLNFMDKNYQSKIDIESFRVVKIIRDENKWLLSSSSGNVPNTPPLPHEK